LKLRVYVDTSVFGGCFDEEFMEPSNQLIKEIRSCKKTLVISDLTLQEIESAPDEVKNVLQSISEDHREYLALDDESKYLAQKYIEEKAISQNYLVDAQHIAIATVNKIDVLVSWNYKHIVNLRKIHLYNAANLKYGYSMIEIRSPREIINEQ
jgi:hypothetical protein